MLQFTGFSCLIWGPKLYTGCCHRQQLFRQYIASRSTQTVWDFVQRQKYHWCVIYMMLYTNALHFKWLHYVEIAQTFIIHNSNTVIVRGDYRHSNRHAPQREAQYAFKDLMTHGILQFALRIAFRCVLHRCKNLDIRCWKLFTIYI